MLKDRLGEDLKVCMKSRETLAVETLRMLLAAVKNEEIARRRSLSEDEELAVLRHAVKSRQDAVALYEKGGRPELAGKERAEIEVILRYLPEQLSEEDLTRAVDEVVKDLGVTSKKEMGRVMKELAARHPGRFDGRTASRIVAARLA